MRTRQLLLETFFRKKTIAIAHIGLLPVYYIAYLSFGAYEPFGIYVLVVAGILLPLILSNGIFGNDIRSGRFRSIVTKPVGLVELYLCRVLGLVIQGVIHLVFASGILLIWHHVTGNANLSNYGLWVLAAMMLFVSSAVLSTTVSIVMKGEHNSLILLFSFLSCFVISALAQAPTGVFIFEVFSRLLPIINYCLPPVVMMHAMCFDGADWRQVAVVCNHTVLLTAAYGGLGILALYRRQYTPQR